MTGYPVSLRVHVAFGWIAGIAVIGIVLLLLLSPLTVEIKDGEPGDWGSPRLQIAHNLVMATIAYAQDHGGRFPDGKSSTEAFQKLIDGGYVKDSAVFYFPFPGKTKAVSGGVLKSENNCWDITSGSTLTDSDDLPVVYETGWRVAYVPDGGATALSNLPPQTYYSRPQTWRRWWNGEKVYYSITAAGKGGWARDENFEAATAPFVIPNFVPKIFDAKGKIYRQLTPEGMLP